MRYVNYLGDPINVRVKNFPDETPQRTRDQLVINHVGHKRAPPGIIDYTGLERTIELEGVLPVRADWGKLKFSVDEGTVIAEYATLERLGAVHYKITAIVSVSPEDPDLDEDNLIGLLEREANRHAKWLDSVVASDTPPPPEVQYWDDQFTDDGSRHLVFLVNGHEVVADSVPETVEGQIHDLPSKILSSEAELPLPAQDLLTLMREAVIEQKTAMSSTVFDDSEEPPF